ncbi:MAG: hypothetical protein U1C58_06245 [Flavobacteriaceae bacterium]|nr:hypothetical protein [Flavobacteriaceae bacterium]MDZ4147865.1 hypothetical protein [Flavobacteriaceae bacterium]
MTPAQEKLLKQYEAHCRKIAQATTININESPAVRIARVQVLEKDYAKWFEYYFPMYAKSPCASFHKDMANLIIKNKIIDLLAEIYRSGAKSVHIDMGIPLHLYLKNDLRFMLLIGQTADKGKKLIADIQAQLQHNQRIINDYGNRYKYGDWSEGDFSTTDGAKFVSSGFRQSVRGLREASERPDYIAVDDVDTKEMCNNERRSRRAYEWVWEDLKGTFDEGGIRRRFIVANNNFHKNTIINQLKQEFQRINANAKAAKKPITHHIITVKAVKDLSTFEPAWPEKTTSDYWRDKFENTPYRSFMREYMHVHIQEGEVFKPEQLQWKRQLPYNEYDGLVFYGDLSYKDAGDFKAMVLVGKTGRAFHVLAAYVRQTSRANVATWLYDFVRDEGLTKYNVRYKIEGLFAQDEFVNDFDLEGDERGWYIPVVADKKSKTNKFDRIESMVGYFERGDVSLNEAYRGSTDFQNLEDQLLAFEKGSNANDDAPDALQSAIAEVNQITFVTKFQPKTISRRELIKNKKNRY